MGNEVKKNIVTEVTGALIDSGFATLATAAGFPPIALASPFAKGLILGLIETCYNDCAQKTMSVSESKKFERVSKVALQTFGELAEKDKVVAWELNMDPAYFGYAYEVAEHATMEAIRQSERKKVDVLGRFYGSQFYKGNSDWQDMHQVITMVGVLTYRQIVMIRLISEGFEKLDGNLFVSNPYACVEINRLKDYGIWQTEGAAFGINESWAIQLKSIIPTRYSDQVSKALMLDRLSEDDVKRTIETLRLTTEGEQQRTITEEDYRKHTEWQSFDEQGNLQLDNGIYSASLADEESVKDIVRKYK